MRILYFLNVLHWLYLGIHMKIRSRIGPPKTDHQIRPPKETAITFDSQKIWRSLSTFLKDYKVYFPIQEINCNAMINLVKIAQKVNSLPRTKCWYKFSYKSALICHIPWYNLYMVGKLIKSTFKTNKQHIIWTSKQRIRTSLLKAAQKPRRRTGTEDLFVMPQPVGLPPPNMVTSVHNQLGGLFLV
jgi:hypothetical protein